MAKRTHSLMAMAAVVTMWTTPVVAQQPAAIDFDEALRLAREHAPELLAARTAMAVADAEVESARIWRHNPALSVQSGPRLGPNDVTVDFMFGIKQPFAPGGRPEARRALAQAQRDVAALSVRDEERQIVAEAARAFAAVLYWQHRAGLTARHKELATEVESVAKRRKELGDVGSLDTSLASLASSRADADSARVESAIVDARSRLGWLLGLDESADLQLAGDLRDVARTESDFAAQARSDVALANAEVEVARAQQHLATRDRIPRLAIGAMGGREEDSTVIKGVLEVTLPLFWRGQRELLSATAQEQASLDHAHVTASRAELEARTARRKVAVLDQAVARFGEGGLAAVAQTSEIASASYRAGAIALPELLAVRRELIGAERDFAELLLLAALARIDALERSGGLDDVTNIKATNRRSP